MKIMGVDLPAEHHTHGMPFDLWGCLRADEQLAEYVEIGHGDEKLSAAGQDPVHAAQYGQHFALLHVLEHVTGVDVFDRGVGEPAQVAHVPDMVHVRTRLHVEDAPTAFPFLPPDV